MGECNTKRRQYVEKTINIPLIFQLVILLRNRKEVMYLCTRSSLALRVVGLCELSIGNAIDSVDGIVLVLKSPETNILKEFSYSVSQVKFDYKRLVKYLNGEKGNKSGIKDLRSKIYKEMESRGLIKIKKGMVFNKISLNSIEIWQDIFNKIVHESESKCLSRETTALLVALNYIDGLESLLLQCSESVASALVESLDSIKGLLESRGASENNKLFYEILSVLN